VRQEEVGGHPTENVQKAGQPERTGGSQQEPVDRSVPGHQNLGAPLSDSQAHTARDQLGSPEAHRHAAGKQLGLRALAGDAALRPDRHCGGERYFRKAGEIATALRHDGHLTGLESGSQPESSPLTRRKAAFGPQQVTPERRGAGHSDPSAGRCRPERFVHGSGGDGLQPDGPGLGDAGGVEHLGEVVRPVSGGQRSGREPGLLRRHGDRSQEAQRQNEARHSIPDRARRGENRSQVHR
jgi:hypothetical protein